MKPLEYLTKFKKNINDSIGENFNSSDEFSINKFLRESEALIEDLESVRFDSNKTKKIINDFLNNYNTVFKEIEQQFYIIWLVDAFNADESYTHAYNALAQYANRKNETLPYPIKSIKNLKYIIEDEANSSTGKKELEKSFQWEGNSNNELEKLFKLMKDKQRLIAAETTYEQFEDIFTGKPIDDITPIKWKSKTVLLAYFLNKMRNESKISVDTDLWAKGAKCFEGFNKKTLANAYQNSLNNINPKNKGLPKDHILIDYLFE